MKFKNKRKSEASDKRVLTYFVWLSTKINFEIMWSEIIAFDQNIFCTGQSKVLGPKGI